MFKDVALNVGIVVFSGSGTSQLLYTVMVISCYAHLTALNLPYDSKALSILEVGSSVQAVVVLLLTGLSFDPQT